MHIVSVLVMATALGIVLLSFVANTKRLSYIGLGRKRINDVGQPNKCKNRRRKWMRKIKNEARLASFFGNALKKTIRLMSTELKEHEGLVNS